MRVTVGESSFCYCTVVFVLVNDLLFSGISLFLLFLVCFGNAYDYVFVVCFFLLYAFVFYVYCRPYPLRHLSYVLSLTFHVPPTGVSEKNYLTCYVFRALLKSLVC